MAYTDYETRKHWGSLDKKALNKWVDELEVDESEIVDTITSFGYDSNDINSHIYATLYIAGNTYLKTLRDFCDENDIIYSGSKLDENNDHQLLSIYTNYLDSGFDSEVNDYITPNPTEQEIIDFLKVIDIDCSEFEQKLEELDR